MAGTLWLAGICVCATVPAALAGLYDSWGYKAQIRFSGYTPAETLSNFPTLVVLGTNVSGFAYSQFKSGTDDLGFTDAKGTTLNYWTYTNMLGTVTESQGVFSTNQTGLARNTTYYYAVLVSNQYGTAQSPVTNFTTLPYVWITASMTNAESQTNAYSGVPVVVDGSNVVLTLSGSATYGQLPVYQFGSLVLTNGASVVCLGRPPRRTPSPTPTWRSRSRATRSSGPGAASTRTGRGS